MDFSVVICTHNRAGEVARTLDALTRLEIPPACTWEVLVVDNASTDSTAALQSCAAFNERLPLRWVVEPTLGLSCARNRGLAHARGDAVLFLDDDVDVSPKLLHAYATALAEHRDAAIFGGPIVPVFEVPPSATVQTFARMHPWLFSAIDLGPTPRIMSPREGPLGANMLIRREFIGSLQFDETLGYVGTGGPGGEEIAFALELSATGRPGWWVPDASVAHRIPRHRVEWKAVRRHATAAARGAARLDRIHHGIHQSPSRRLVFWLWREAQWLRLRAIAQSPFVDDARRVHLWFASWHAWAGFVEALDVWRSLS